LGGRELGLDLLKRWAGVFLEVALAVVFGEAEEADAGLDLGEEGVEGAGPEANGVVEAC